MASLRSCLARKNVQCFSKTEWSSVCKNNKISREEPVLMLLRNKREMHSQGNVTTPQITLLGPSVKRLLESYGLDQRSIKPSGDKGQLLKGDVLKYINEKSKTAIKFPQIVQEEFPSTAHIPQESYLDYIDLGVTATRREIARQLVNSKNDTPHTYNSIDCNVDSLMTICKKFDDCVSIDDFVVKAAGLALQLVPKVNMVWFDDSTMTQLSDINIGIAFDSPNGAFTSVIQHVDQLDVSRIALTMKELKGKALSGHVSPSDKPQHASVTISSLQNSGIKSFTAIVNRTQSVMLTVGDLQVLVGDDYKRSTVVNVTFCCDGRVVDEQLASEWLTVFKHFMENPLRMAL